MSNPIHLLETIMSDCIGSHVLVNDYHWQMGGDINRAASVSISKGQYFVKWNELRYVHMFEVEAKGLDLLGEVSPLKVPEVIGTGKAGGHAYLVLEQLEKGFQSDIFWQKLGEGLAALHLHKEDSFGLDHDNYIGRLHQRNTYSDDWLDFFIYHRLKDQLDLAIENGFVSGSFINEYNLFLNKLPQIMPRSEASLLHGDLWSGNAMAVSGNQASIYDPAVYYGAREMDLAMTRLFGGFDGRFYEAYHSVYPIPVHFEELVDVYNLYPLMVHVNLFGAQSGYAGTVSRIVRRYL